MDCGYWDGYWDEYTGIRTGTDCRKWAVGAEWDGYIGICRAQSSEGVIAYEEYPLGKGKLAICAPGIPTPMGPAIPVVIAVVPTGLYGVVDPIGEDG